MTTMPATVFQACLLDRPARAEKRAPVVAEVYTRKPGDGENWKRARLSIYGFGAAGHGGIQTASARGADAYGSTRDCLRHQVLSEDLGAPFPSFACLRETK